MKTNNYNNKFTRVLVVLYFLTQLSSFSQCFGELTVGGHVCTIKPDGSLWGWGLSDYGELGNPENGVEPSPIQISTANDWVKVKNGTYNTFAIKNNGTLWGVGGNDYGSLGTGSTTQVNTSFQQIGTATNWADIAPSSTGTIALRTNGTLWAWGQNDNGEMGNGTIYPQQLTPIQIGTDTNWAAIEMLTSDTGFAIKTNGTLWGWGFNNAAILVPDSSVYSVSTPIQIGTDTDWLKLQGGSSHALVQKTNGTLWAMGGSTNGELGLGTVINQANPPIAIGTDTWKFFSTGLKTSFGIKSNGTLWAWGKNNNGQLGDGTTVDRFVPTQIGTDTNWATVHASFGNAVATKTDGSFWAWGNNYYGIFGNGSSYSEVFTIVPTQTVGICSINPLGIQEFDTSNTIQLYPNPAKDQVTVEYVLFSQPTVSIFDLTGRLLIEKQGTSNNGYISIETSNYPSGIYIVLVKEEGKIVSQQKLIIE